jgi:hypothetical protein
MGMRLGRRVISLAETRDAREGRTELQEQLEFRAMDHTDCGRG